MTSGSPSSDQPVTSGKRILTVDIGVATIAAACILAGGGVVGLFIGRATTSGAISTLSTPGEALGPASATIKPPPTGDITFASTLNGHVVNLQRGQSVWTFAQAVTANGSFGATTYPNAGPCTVDFATNTWTCSNVYIGRPKDNNTYRVCVAILNLPEAYAVVKLIENTYASTKMNLPYWFTSPPSYLNDNYPHCMSVHRIN
jgi:hypothetical protein